MLVASVFACHWHRIANNYRSREYGHAAIELRHMRCFLCVARHLHFARAADELGIAPPVADQADSGSRTAARRAALSSDEAIGRADARRASAYLGEALVALDHLARGAERAVLAERGELGKIVIGYVGSAVYSGVLQATVRGFRARYPRVEIGIEEIVMREVGALLMRRAHRYRLCAAADAVPGRRRGAHRASRCVHRRVAGRFAAGGVARHHAGATVRSVVRRARAGIRHARSGAARALHGAGRRAAAARSRTCSRMCRWAAMSPSCRARSHSA